MKKISLINRLIYKYMVGTRENATLKIMSIIAIISISITTAVLLLQLFIIAGFEKEFSTKMQNIYPDVFITAGADESFNFIEVTKLFQQKYPIITAAAPSHTKHALIKANGIFYDTIVTVRAIDPILEQTVSSLTTRLVQAKPLQEVLQEKNIIIGSKLLKDLGLSIGDEITLVIQEDTDQKEISQSTFTNVRCTISNTVETGVSYLDAGLVICSLETMKNVFGDDTISTISFKLTNSNNNLILVRHIQNNFPYQVDCWQTLYPSLLAAAQLEKYVGTTLLILMLLIACTTITGFIFMQIMRKKRDIALLKIMGFTNDTLMKIFTSMGLFLTCFASLIGTAFAVTIGFCLKKYHWIELPDAYDVTYLPLEITWKIIIGVLILVIGTGFTATYCAVLHVRRINVTHTLRFEE